MAEIKAELMDHMGTDLLVVNSARVSFDKESDWETNYDVDPAYRAVAGDRGVERLSARDTKLIRYLARHGHWTPFSHPQITLRETVPIFVARQRFKHMVGFTYNEVSRRYVDDEPTFYVPNWRWRADNVKQGSGRELTQEEHHNCLGAHEYERVVTAALNTYHNLIEDGIAPEQARMVLPQSMMTSYYVTGSLAAFARAYNQRIDPHAQREIQILAEQWDTIIRPLFPISWEALTQS